jgi:hypothetical protein
MGFLDNFKAFSPDVSTFNFRQDQITENFQNTLDFTDSRTIIINSAGASANPITKKEVSAAIANNQEQALTPNISKTIPSGSPLINLPSLGIGTPVLIVAGGIAAYLILKK